VEGGEVEEKGRGPLILQPRPNEKILSNLVVNVRKGNMELDQAGGELGSFHQPPEKE